MRCQNCLQIAISDIRSCEVLQKPSFASLKTSAEAGCDLCGLSYAALMSNYSHATTEFEGQEAGIIDLLCRGLNPTRADRHDTRIYLEGEMNDYYQCSKFKEKVEKVSVRVGGFSAGQNAYQALLKVGVDSGSILTKYIAGRMPSAYPDDSILMSRIKGWIKTCDQKHKNCAFLSASRLQPKRILDISKDKPVVLHTKFAEGRYVALSYCWGTSGENVLLTSSTFDKFTSTGIDVDTLPKTIKDAIIVCKSLGIYRIWIDALCIIQKESDNKDFIAEAPRMSEYYRNAYLTLIAGSARDCADGFLNKRVNLKSAPCELAYDRTTLSSDQDMTGVVKIFMSPSQERGPIQDRAWTFQESALSQRSLVYGLEQVQFICPTFSVFEDGEFQQIYSPGERLPSNPRGYPNIHHLVRHNNQTEVMDRTYELWFGILYGYSLRKLSDPRDKLAAIAGYANLVQRIVQCRYMYGLWENSLCKGLLWAPRKPWVSSGNAGTVTRILDRAPSWSWASIDGPILHSFTHIPREQFKDPKSFRLEILSYDNIPSSFDPIREVKDTSKAFELAVRGSLKGVWHVSTPTSRQSEFMLSDIRVDLNSTTSSAKSQNTQLQNSPAREHVAVGTWDTYDDFERKPYCGQEIHALLLMPEAGLLLTHVDGRRYRRIGQFWRSKENLFKNTKPKDIILI